MLFNHLVKKNRILHINLITFKTQKYKLLIFEHVSKIMREDCKFEHFCSLNSSCRLKPLIKIAISELVDMTTSIKYDKVIALIVPVSFAFHPLLLMTAIF